MGGMCWNLFALLNVRLYTSYMKSQLYLIFQAGHLEDIQKDDGTQKINIQLD